MAIRNIQYGLTAVLFLFGFLGILLMIERGEQFSTIDDTTETKRQVHDTGRWSLWQEGSCTFTSAGCIVINLRRCLGPGNCTGLNYENVSCNHSNCPAMWTPWMTTKDNQGRCVHQRERDCTGYQSVIDCDKGVTDTYFCNTSEWSSWENWSCNLDKNRHCDYRRQRECYIGLDNKQCEGSSIESTNCTTDNCKDYLNPTWSEWNAWRCIKHDTVCYTVRNRTCSTGTNTDCSTGDDYLESVQCTGNDCQVTWLDWSHWECLTAHGRISAHRVRNCSTYNATDCVGVPFEIRECGFVECPVCHDPTYTSPAIEWLGWSSWQCSFSSGKHFHVRFRNCSTGREMDCLNGKNHDVHTCSPAECPACYNDAKPVHTPSPSREWLGWSSWECSFSTGIHFHIRFRNCSTGQTTGCLTDGKNHEINMCSPEQCPACYDGTSTSPAHSSNSSAGWLGWSSWECSSSDGVLFHVRFRNCSTGRTLDCTADGKNNDIRMCSPEQCPECYIGMVSSVHSTVPSKGWLAWSSWDCGSSEGVHFHIRFRNCSTGNISDCLMDGTNNELHMCSPKECPGCYNGTLSPIHSTSPSIGSKPFWHAWAPWNCHSANGFRFRVRHRNCSIVDECSGSPHDLLFCDESRCPECFNISATGTWSVWSHWECSVSHNQTFRVRYRNCSTDDCLGLNHDLDYCTQQLCPECHVTTTQSTTSQVVDSCSDLEPEHCNLENFKSVICSDRSLAMRYCRKSCNLCDSTSGQNVTNAMYTTTDVTTLTNTTNTSTNGTDTSSGQHVTNTKQTTDATTLTDVTHSGTINTTPSTGQSTIIVKQTTSAATALTNIHHTTTTDVSNEKNATSAKHTTTVPIILPNTTDTSSSVTPDTNGATGTTTSNTNTASSSDLTTTAVNNQTMTPTTLDTLTSASPIKSSSSSSTSSPVVMTTSQNMVTMTTPTTQPSTSTTVLTTGIGGPTTPQISTSAVDSCFDEKPEQCSIELFKSIVCTEQSMAMQFCRKTCNLCAKQTTTASATLTNIHQTPTTDVTNEQNATSAKHTTTVPLVLPNTTDTSSNVTPDTNGATGTTASNTNTASPSGSTTTVVNNKTMMTASSANPASASTVKSSSVSSTISSLVKTTTSVSVLTTGVGEQTTPQTPVLDTCFDAEPDNCDLDLYKSIICSEPSLAVKHCRKTCGLCDLSNGQNVTTTKQTTIDATTLTNTTQFSTAGTKHSIGQNSTSIELTTTTTITQPNTTDTSSNGTPYTNVATGTTTSNTNTVGSSDLTKTSVINQTMTPASSAISTSASSIKSSSSRITSTPVPMTTTQNTVSIAMSTPSPTMTPASSAISASASSIKSSSSSSTSTPVPMTTTHNLVSMTTPTPAPTTSVPALTTGVRGHTIPPIPTRCAVCVGPPDLCDELFDIQTCDPPNNYCINHVKNLDDGSREITRACGNHNTCYREWLQGSSDKDKCQNFVEDSVITLAFECTYCCIKDECNVNMIPDLNTLYQDV